jgi:hypothetical protein
VDYTKRFSTRGNTVMKNEVQWKKLAIENGAKQGRIVRNKTACPRNTEMFIIS